MIKRLALGLGLLVVASCASPPPPAPPPPPPPPKVTPAPAVDQCGAAEAQSYVGRNRITLPVPVQPALQRVTCNTCPVTLDYNPRRLNFFYDARTGLVTQVRCG